MGPTHEAAVVVVVVVVEDEDVDEEADLPTQTPTLRVACVAKPRKWRMVENLWKIECILGAVNNAHTYVSRPLSTKSRTESICEN